MCVIDLIHTITQDMPVYPGSGTPALRLPARTRTVALRRKKLFSSCAIAWFE